MTSSLRNDVIVTQFSRWTEIRLFTYLTIQYSLNTDMTLGQPGQLRSPEVASGPKEGLPFGYNHFDSNIGMVDGMASLDRAYWTAFVRVSLKIPVRRLGKIPQLESVQ